MFDSLRIEAPLAGYGSHNSGSEFVCGRVKRTRMQQPIIGKPARCRRALLLLWSGSVGPEQSAPAKCMYCAERASG